MVKSRIVFSVLLLACFGETKVLFAEESALKVERLIRPARFARGETNQNRLSLFDSAAWVTHGDLVKEIQPEEFRIVRFRKEFNVTAENPTFEVDVSADERFYLMCDGEFIAKGPHRGTPDNWMFQSYKLTLKPGKHVMEAVVWKHTEGNAPRAQLSIRLAFALAASKPYDKELTTGIAPWLAGIVEGVTENGYEGGPWGAGAQNKAIGAGMYALMPSQFKATANVRSAIRGIPSLGGDRTGDWQTYPSQIKDQLHRRISLGRSVLGAFNTPMTIAPNTVVTNIFDLGEYRSAYPYLVISGGRGATVVWRWAESLVDPANGFKYNRNDWKGKKFEGFGDTFISDGRKRAEFSSSWFRCGRWCQIVIETKDEPLAIDDISLIESRYPLECESKFSSPQMPDAKAIEDICARSMKMCSHEMFFDCPFYEQQMYPGDTRTQLNVVSAMTSDDSLIRRAIEIYDLSKFSDGLVPFNYPTTGRQEGLSYTLCYLLMYGDYVKNHSSKEWLKARLPGIRNTLSGIEYYAREDGLLAEVPGWTFIDWPKTKDWVFGTPPGGRERKPIGPLNGFWLLALRAGAEVEKALGNDAMASHWSCLAEKVASSCRKTFWDEKRGLFSDDLDKKHFSEHTQSLMLLGDALRGDEARSCFEKLITDPSLVRATVYFKYYLFETYFKFSRADLFFRDLDLWRSYLKLGCTTCIEEPETPEKSARSDCHAWGAHPLYFMRAKVAGIMPGAPFFEKVLIAPQPGHLKEISAQWPHPSGKMIEVELKFDGENVTGSVTTPVSGVFDWRGRKIPLASGKNVISLTANK